MTYFQYELRRYRFLALGLILTLLPVMPKPPYLLLESLFLLILTVMAACTYVDSSRQLTHLLPLSSNEVSLVRKKAFACALLALICTTQFLTTAYSLRYTPLLGRVACLAVVVLMTIGLRRWTKAYLPAVLLGIIPTLVWLSWFNHNYNY